ncbi:unnamed protein product [Chrysodeixis includens]|uniref:Uncharacterized protein n=1 Tax=Chrysodeixis includens TaxID=689277 RepID=A0A9P0BW12_CHRIL|nr:unnamed protein product [Chrysodeixis includens]
MTCDKTPSRRPRGPFGTRPPFEVIEIWFESLVMYLSKPGPIPATLLADIVQYSRGAGRRARGSPEPDRLSNAASELSVPDAGLLKAKNSQSDFEPRLQPLLNADLHVKIKAHFTTRFTPAVCAIVCGSRGTGGQLSSRITRAAATSAGCARALCGRSAGDRSGAEAGLASCDHRSAAAAASARITGLVSLEIKSQFRNCCGHG